MDQVITSVEKKSRDTIWIFLMVQILLSTFSFAVQKEKLQIARDMALVSEARSQHSGELDKYDYCSI